MVSTSSNPDHHLSNEAVIAIVSLVAAVIVVPIVSKYYSHWINRRCQQRDINGTEDVVGASSRSQDVPQTTQGIPQAPLAETEVNALEIFAMPPLAHLASSRSSNLMPIAQITDRIIGESINRSNIYEVTNAQGITYDIYELEATPGVSGWH
ncbi:hypothetical protein F5Y08DRAFT_334539 [Xylaria arbuscula]|nr:hypothetical protein F5Y08DRAFT_334539 [Xylaria arbuscula]